LFGESQSRVVVSVRPEKLDAFVETLAETDIDFTNLGEVGSNLVMIDETDYGQIEVFGKLHADSIGDMMHAG
jgi:phosphoribosylformylglycinamidine synthase